ncbi:glycosyltransferase family 2 protein [Microbacterium allomyrinae]|uniref:Glycosyltransferase n=1 Tax=Microbacterium allomyrinae TaxID=2830666 RepID=A0A9X1S4A1_9MICO|nr:glycosyltransferase [Microbacterium allomyrinae]MCC2034019.1 glycosyltransferase [Microbacterium allomyrinae]
MSELTLSVVLPSYHRLELLPRLVDEYRRQGANQIIIVLDGPHPGWEDVIARSGPVEVVELAVNRGLARARIAGLERVRCDLVLAVDDDVVPEPGLVDRHRAAHAVAQDHVVQGYMPIALPAKRGRDAAPTYLYARDYEIQADAWRRGGSATILKSLWGGNVSLPADLYRRAEAVKPSVRLEYNEDLDLGIRLLELGATAVFDDSARARHHHSRGLRPYLRECEARGGAVHALEQRWGERPAQLTPIVTIPPSYSRVLGAAQRRIAAADSGGLTLASAVVVYRACGAVRLFTLQDGVARFLRRALAMRGYRRALETPTVT